MLRLAAINAGNDWNPDIAVAVALAESGGCIDATHVNSNGTVDRGPWQVNSVHSQYDAKQLTSNLAYSAEAAHEIWKSSGWGAWTTFTTGAYKSHLGNTGHTKIPGIIAGDILGTRDPAADATRAVGLNPPDPIGSTLDMTKFIWNHVGQLFTGEFWVRVLKIVAGGIALTLAVLMAMKEFSNTPVGKNISNVAKVAAL